MHVLINVNKRAFANAKNHQKQINADIEILDQAATEEQFDELATLFLKKWDKKEANFSRYFEEQWLGDLKYWFVGASIYDPSENNHIEGEFFIFLFVSYSFISFRNVFNENVFNLKS